jgi:NAD(P)-dependent dehydrogenase (short-subunit alcohol dehydrogenase family)
LALATRIEESVLMSGLQGRSAIVTGAASGVGEASARLLAERGAAVVIADINGERAEAVAQDIRSSGARAIAVAVDVSDEPQVAELVEVARREFGGIHILHNNAAALDVDTLTQDALIEDADPELWQRVIGVNLIGYVLCTKHAVREMVAGGHGVVVNTTSGTGLQAELVRPAYGTSKAAIIGLTRNIATQYGRHGIRAVGVALGIVGTPALKAYLPLERQQRLVSHQLVPRLIEPRDVAEVVAFLASDAAAMITGTTVTVDAGFSAHIATYADDVAELTAVGNAGE